MAKPYTALSPISHDGLFYLIGDRIELEDKDAKPLLDVGAIAELSDDGDDSSAKATPANSKPATPAKKK